MINRFLQASKKMLTCSLALTNDSVSKKRCARARLV